MTILSKPLRALALGIAALSVAAPASADMVASVVQNGWTTAIIHDHGPGASIIHRGVPAPGVIIGVPSETKRWRIVADNCSLSDVTALRGEYRSVLDTLPPGLPLRVFTPTQGIGTMDYLAARMNVWLNSTDIITDVTCG